MTNPNIAEQLAQALKPLDDLLVMRKHDLARGDSTPGSRQWANGYNTAYKQWHEEVTTAFQKMTKTLALYAESKQGAAQEVVMWHASGVMQDNNGQTFIATIGPYEASPDSLHYEDAVYQVLGNTREECEANLATLMSALAAAPAQPTQTIAYPYAEMRRLLPVLERAENDPVIWEALTKGTGIATLNGYRAALNTDPAMSAPAAQPQAEVPDSAYEQALREEIAGEVALSNLSKNGGTTEDMQDWAVHSYAASCLRNALKAGERRAREIAAAQARGA